MPWATKALLLAVTLLLCATAAHAQSMRAVTSTPGPALHVVVTWPPDAVSRRFNLYRKPATAGASPRRR